MVQLAYLETLAAVLATTDSVLEPDRSSKDWNASRSQAQASRTVRGELLERYHDCGVRYYPDDRSPGARIETSKRLAAMAGDGLIVVRATPGRTAYVKTTADGALLGRRCCGLPTLTSATPMFVRLVASLKDKSAAQWQHHGCLSELALIHKRQWSGRGENVPRGARGRMLGFLSPLLHAELVESYSNVDGNVWLCPTDKGREFYGTLDLATVGDDWEAAWEAEFDDTLDSGLVTGEEWEHLQAIYNSVFTREREGLRTAKPERGTELGRIPWPKNG